MTDPDIDVDASDGEPAMTHEKAAEVVEKDPALQQAGSDSSDSPADSASSSEQS